MGRYTESEFATTPVGAKGYLPNGFMNNEVCGKYFKVGGQLFTRDGHYVATSEFPTLNYVYYTDSTFLVSGQDTNPFGLCFKSDGTKMYMLGNTNDTVYQYTLSTAWEPITATYDTVSFSVTTQENYPRSLNFNADGSKMYVLGNLDTVFQYDLTTPWDLSTATYNSVSFSGSSQSVSIEKATFSHDGTLMFLSTAGVIYEYTLSTGWDVSTASYSSSSYNFSSIQNISTYIGTSETTWRGILFYSSGAKALIYGSTTDTVYQLILTTPYSLSTATYYGVYYKLPEPDVHQIMINESGKQIYVIGANGDRVYTCKPAISTNTANFNTNIGVRVA